MANNITKILFRRGTNAERKNVVFNLGEPAYTIDTKRFFIGDGVTLGGISTSITNFGFDTLAGSYLDSGLSQSLYKRLVASGTSIGDFVYDGATSSLYTITAVSTIPNITNFARYSITTDINTSQFKYTGTQLSVTPGGIGASEINSSAISTGLSGGNGSAIAIKTNGVTNALLDKMSTNSVKVNNTNDNTSPIDLQINTGQILGRTSVAGSLLGAITLSVTDGITLSANTNTFLLSARTPLPIQGGTMLGDINVGSNRIILSGTNGFTTPYDVVNKTYVDKLSSALALSAIYAWALSSFVPLTGSVAITGPLSSSINSNDTALRITQLGTGYSFRVDDESSDQSPFIIDNTGNVFIGGLTQAPGAVLSIYGSTSASGSISALNIIVGKSPTLSAELTNKNYVDSVVSNKIPLSGYTSIKGPLTAAVNSSEVALRINQLGTGYAFRVDDAVADQTPFIIDNNGSVYIGGLKQAPGAVLSIYGSTSASGSISALNVIVSKLPTLSAELTNKNYVDDKITLNNTIQAPPGMIAYFARSTAPSGWIKANGAVLQKIDYRALYDALPKQGAPNQDKTIWWVDGDGQENFRIPDLRGRFIRSWNDNIAATNKGSNVLPIPSLDLINRPFGGNQDDALASHTHTVFGTTSDEHGTSLAKGIEINNKATGGVNKYLSLNDIAGVNPTGDTETRPDNIALLACIKI